MNITILPEQAEFIKKILIEKLEKSLRDDYSDLDTEDLLNLDSTEFKLSLKKVNWLKDIVRKLTQ